MEKVKWKGGRRLRQEEMEREVREAVREVERELRGREEEKEDGGTKNVRIGKKR